jgi:NADH-quinone oxidoreductase subunit H
VVKLASSTRRDFFKALLAGVAIALLIGVALDVVLLYRPLLDVLSYLFTNPSLILIHPLFMVLIFPGLGFVGIVAVLAIWGERKFAAKVQNRVGPLYAGALPGGILQPIADLLKLLFKEIIIPKDSDRLVFVMAPVAAFLMGAAPVALVPYSPSYVIFDFPLSLLLFFVFTGFFPMVLLLAGWSSNNKFSFIGGLRALYQQASYEIPMFLSALSAVMLAKSFSLMDIAKAQTGVWFIVLAPISAVVFFTAVLAELEKFPFEIPEAESEIVAGWMTEYSGMTYGLYWFGIYVKLVAFSGLFAVLFLGGWNGPLIPAPWWMIIKVGVVATLIISTRAFFPRIRIDQLISAGWTKLIPLALFNILILVALQPWLVRLLS